MKKNNIKTIGIIGYGHFGRLLSSIFMSHAKVLIYSRKIKPDQKNFFPLARVLESDLIIPSVPINTFEKVIQDIASQLAVGTCVMDVCSVKAHPAEVMKKFLPKHVTCIATHPLFGPGALRKLSGKIKGLRIVIDMVSGDKNKYMEVKNLLSDLGFKLLMISPAEHDQMVAQSQFPSHIVAHLAKMNIKQTQVDTNSTIALNDFLEMVNIDKQLLVDMYQYNPYCRDILKKLQKSFLKINSWLK